ncbi:MAG: hypothetical protein V4674_01470 [Patescibacteria group bacterium]
MITESKGPLVGPDLRNWQPVVTQNLGLIRAVADKYRYRAKEIGYDYSDLIHFGTLGLMKSAPKLEVDAPPKKRSTFLGRGIEWGILRVLREGAARVRRGGDAPDASGKGLFSNRKFLAFEQPLVKGDGKFVLEHVTPSAALTPEEIVLMKGRLESLVRVVHAFLRILFSMKKKWSAEQTTAVLMYYGLWDETFTISRAADVARVLGVSTKFVIGACNRFWVCAKRPAHQHGFGMRPETFALTLLCITEYENRLGRRATLGDLSLSKA